MSIRLLQDKTIVLGVTGSIAAYKAVEIASRLVKAGAHVDVALTEAATRLVAPLTFQAIVHRPVATNLFDPRGELGIDHVALAKRADVIAIAPITANTLAKLAHGLADDVVSTTFLA
ncbi:MAG: flavoprotein, partial [Anaerolineae bacterium]